MNSLLSKLLIYLLSIALSGWFFYGVGKDKEAKKLLEYQNAQKALMIEQENKYQDMLVQSLKEKENAIKDLNKRHSVIVNSLQQRPTRQTTNKETSSSPVCTGTASTGDRLYREDAEFLIGEATRAEIIKQALRACRQQLEQ